VTTLSVLICTLNRHELLGKALESLRTQTLDKPDQIVVVNGGDERAESVVKEAQAATTTEIVLVKTVNKNLATSRNLGMQRCTGDILAMTDDDAVVFPDWIKRLKSLHQEHPEAGAVGGLVLGTDSNTVLSKVADIATFPRWEKECYVRTLPGVNISYKRDVVLQIGPQDESLARGEDVDFNWRLLQLGHKILFSPDVKVYHFHRPSLRGLVNQQYMYGRSYLHVRKKHSDMYSILPGRRLSLANLVKGVKFGSDVILEPIAALKKLHGFDKVTCFPLIAFLEIAWRWGMVRESFNS
jgi:GT2 family glycosyltransferase